MRAKIFFGLLLFVGLSFGFVSTSSAQDLLPEDNGIFTYHQPPRWRESESHPIRFVSYIAHPVGWVLREGIFRPFSALAASTRFTRSFMGYREPFDFRNPICFKGAEEIPDCKQVPPYNSIGMGKEEPAEEPAAMVSTERQVFFPDVNFDFDKASLNDLGRGRVRQVAQLLASVPSVRPR